MYRSLSSRAKRQLQSCYSVFVLNGMLALSIGSLLPYIRDARGLDYVFAGLLVSLHSIGNLLSSFLAGPVAVAVGRKKGVLCFNCFFPIAFLLLLVGNNNFMIAAAFFLTGFARGATSNFCNAVVNDLAPGQASALNGLHAMFSLGAFLFPLILMCITSGGSKRYVWAIIFMLAAGILSFLIYALIPDPEDLKASKEESGEAIIKDKSLNFLKEKLFWLVVFSLFFYLCTEQGVIGWMVTYFEDTGFISEGLSQITASVLWIMIMAGRLTTAYLSTRMDKRKLLPIMGAGILIFFVALLFARNTALIIVCIMGFGFSMAGVYPTVVSFTGDLIRKYSMAWSFILTMASMGSIVMPSVIGHIAESAGIYMGMSSVAVVMVLDLILLIALCRYAIKKEA
ncbi:MAG: MFS transporter [Lachnospiraceae bacterium]|nr:MFS transporter [Lachnospiraceae bacterium]